MGRQKKPHAAVEVKLTGVRAVRKLLATAIREVDGLKKLLAEETRVKVVARGEAVRLTRELRDFVVEIEGLAEQLDRNTGSIGYQFDILCANKVRLDPRVYAAGEGKVERGLSLRREIDDARDAVTKLQTVARYHRGPQGNTCDEQPERKS